MCFVFIEGSKGEENINKTRQKSSTFDEESDKGSTNVKEE